MLIVAKFGGSSLADAGQFRKVADIVRADARRRFIVVSAPGKGQGESQKITDLLYSCADLSWQGRDFSAPFKLIRSRFDSICRELNIPELGEDMDKIEENIKNGASRDYIASRGEYLCGKALASFLGVSFLDSANFIFFGPDGKVDYDRSYPAICTFLRERDMAVIPGFYGLSAQGIKTFSRGGSDITGSLIAAATEADVYENWTDVSGIMSADPRLVKNPEVIPAVSYNELREMAYMGASVLHEEAVFPVKARRIPIIIKNTDQPLAPGTVISDSAEKTGRGVTGIACTADFFSVDVRRPARSGPALVKRIMEIFEKKGILIEHMPWGKDTLHVLIHERDRKAAEESLKLIERASLPESAGFRNNLGLIAIVGAGMQDVYSLSERARAILGSNGIETVFSDPQHSAVELILGVDKADIPRAAEILYNELIEKAAL